MGYSARYVSDTFQAAQVNQVTTQAKEQGVSMLPVVNANNDPAKQNEDINSLLGRGIKGLIVNPANSQAIVPAIQKAKAANVPVVTVDTSAAPGAPVAMQVTSDNYQAGQTACEALGGVINAGTVLNLQGDLSTAVGQDRSNGFTDCITKNFPNISVISKPTDWDSDKCADVARAVLTTEKIAGVYAAGTMVCLGPVTTVLQSIDRFAPTGDPKHMPFVAIDGSKPELDAIRDGRLDAVISQPLDQFAKYAIYWLKRAMAGENITAGPTDHNSEVVEINGALTDKLPVTLVTKQNVDDPALWGNQ
ncbi:sugar ABC transporter substrate-binding protein [Pseudarthrobacter oxydans]|uniref:sugar ABC transporter substrate-binding protein n=1 Tax=Pseudarthrobacter oxydans TaxID=1671 RepID=UPI003D2A2E34